MAPSTSLGTQLHKARLAPWSSFYSHAGQDRGLVGLPGKRTCQLLVQGRQSIGHRWRFWGPIERLRPLGALLQGQRSQKGIRYQADYGERRYEHVWRQRQEPRMSGLRRPERPVRLTSHFTTGDTEARGQVIFPMATQQVSGRVGDGTHGFGTQQWLGGSLPDWQQPFLTCCRGMKARASGWVRAFSFPAVKDHGQL